MSDLAAPNYSAREVLDGWRAYLLRGAKESSLDARSNWPPSPLDTGPARKLDVRYLMFHLVERFFIAVPKHRGYKSRLLEHRGHATELAFAEWYAPRPMVKVPAYAAMETDPDPTGKFVPMRLSEAVALWNAKSENRHKQIRYSTAFHAAKRCYDGKDGLFAWRPEGKWHTNLSELGLWWTETTWGGVRAGAGRPRVMA